MRKRLFATVGSVLTCAGVAWAQKLPLPAPQNTTAAAPAPNASIMPAQALFTPLQDAPVDGSAFAPSASTPPRFWGGAEYLYWWVKSQTLSTPVITGSNNPNATNAGGFSTAGGLGVPGTYILQGTSVPYNPMSGGRFTIGAWLDKEAKFGVEAQGFFLGQTSFSRTFSSGPNGSPIIALPIRDTSGAFGGGENAIAESFPAAPALGIPTPIFRGSDSISSHSQVFGGEANGLVNIIQSGNLRIDGLVGFRYAGLAEDVSIVGVSSNILPSAAGGGVAFLNNFYDGTVTSTDLFRTQNNFYGGQLGARGNYQWGKYFVNLTGKVALGDTNQLLQIQGHSQLQTIQGFSALANGGTYAVSSNIGRYNRNAFSVIPQADLKFGYNITDNIRATVGYTFMYWSDVVRPGEQIDRNVDVRQVPTLPNYVSGFGSGSPSPLFRTTDFFAQGINFGLQFRY